MSKRKKKCQQAPKNEVGDTIAPPPKYCCNCSSKLVTKMRGNKKRLVCPKGDYVYRNNPIPVAVLLIPTEDGGLVLVRRKDDPQHLWLPGGYVDAGEHPEAAAIREAAEETTLIVTINKLLGIEVPDDENVVAFFYLTNPTSKTPIAQDDAVEATVYYKNDLRPIDCVHTKRYVDQFFAHFAVGAR